MKLRTTPVAAAAALAVLSAGAQAQSASDPPSVIQITGIRAAAEQSLTTKRNSDSLVEVITAEDVGKLPDKNIADALQRVPGVTISSASASEGGFDENDRVSLRGTNPSLTLTLINGHSVGTGDWFVLNQVGTVGRSVSYSLLPSELVGQVIVRKGSNADVVEGGVAGTVDILTRRPLDFKKSLSLEAMVGAVYADKPDKVDPQLSALVNWKNDAGSFGVMLQAFREERHLRRDGQEMLGYSTIAPGSAIALSNPNLSGVQYPNLLGATLFEQDRTRTGGLLDIQARPFTGLTLDLSGFVSHMKATNFNRNYLLWPSKILNGGAGQAPDPGYVVKNGTLTSATFANLGTGGPDAATRRQYVIDDQIYRPGAKSETSFVDFDASWRATDKLTVTSKVGTSHGSGDTPKQAVFEADIFNTGATYALRGVGGPADAGILAGNPSSFAGARLDWIFGASPAKSKDKENYAQIDGEYMLDIGPLASVKAGVRAAQHKRDTSYVNQGPNFASDPFNPANLPPYDGDVYPKDFGKGLGGGNYIRRPWQLDPQALEDWSDIHSNRDPVTREYFQGEFRLKENIGAAYAMANIEGKGYSGNVGLRFVRTKEISLNNVAIPQRETAPGVFDCAPQGPCSVPGAVTTSAFGAFVRQPTSHVYDDVLPSANFKFELTKELIARAAIAKTIARPDYSALAGAVSLDDTNHTGSGGNPNLKPIRSTNYDAGIEWYFQPRSLLSASAFYLDLKNYVAFGVTPRVFFDVKNQTFSSYNVSAPVNSKGHVRGVELAYQQQFFDNFGVNLNYTYADAEERGGGDLVGASKHSGTAIAFFENNWVNARVAYTYRSTFYNGLDRASAQYQIGSGSLSAALGYKINDNLSINLEGLNLNTPTLRYRTNNTEQPLAFYQNGRQYYLTLRGRI